MRRLSATIAGLALGLLGPGCNTPSVPLPPPVISALGFTAGPSAGQVVLTGQPESRHASALFYALDQATGDGVITTATSDGSFTSPPFSAKDGDTIRLYLETPTGERSQDICVDLVRNAPLIGHTCQ